MFATLSHMNEEKSGFNLDWRVAFGLGVTTLWITAGLFYLLGVVGWGNFVYLPTADIGSFLEGAFAPLAFLWLVIGHFMQQKEITANTKAINLQEMSARRLELHSRRDSYFKLLNLVQEQLGGIASFHYLSVVGSTGTGEVSSEEFADMRSQASKGDSSLFVRKMIGLIVEHSEDPAAVKEILFGTDIRTRHANNFETTFGRLLDAAYTVDTDNMVTDALLYGSAAGIYYRIIRHVSGEEGMNPITGMMTQQSSARVDPRLD